MIRKISLFFYKIFFYTDKIIFFLTKKSFLIWFKEFMHIDSYKKIKIINKDINFFVPNITTD